MAKMNPLLNLKPTVTEEAELVAANAAPPPQPNLQDLIVQYVKLKAEVQTTTEAANQAFNSMQSAIHAAQHLGPGADAQTALPFFTAQKAAEDEYSKALEGYIVASSTLEQAAAAIIPAARDHYAEQTRDKRTESDLVCPTWAPSETTIVDQHDPSRTTVVTYSTGCKCDHMPVRHDKQEENPWCTACQAAHTDGSQPHTFITEEQFINRILTNAV